MSIYQPIAAGSRITREASAKSARPNATKAQSREPKMKGCTKHKLTAAVRAAEADEVEFMTHGGRDGKKGTQRPAHEERET